MLLPTSTLALLFLSLLPIQVDGNDESTRPKELQVLEQFIGTWDVDNVTRFPDGASTRRKIVSRRTWSRGGQFIRFEDEQPDGEPEFHLLMTYDPEKGNYPAVGMHGAAKIEFTGTWNEETKTMSFSGTNPDGSIFKSTHRFLNENSVVASGTITGPNKDVLARLSWNQRRRNPN